MKNILEKFLNQAVNLGERLIIAIIILFVGFKIVNLIVKGLNKGRGYNRLDGSVKSFLNSFITITLKAVVLVIAAGILGIPTTSIITLIGSFGVAIGLALQGGLSNIAGGLMILIFKPFKVGNYISCSAVEGTVADITMFYTKLVTLDNKTVTIPNGVLSSSTVINYNYLDKRRVDLDFSVSYNSDIDKVLEVLNSVAKQHKLVLKDEKSLIRLAKHDNSALVFTYRVWCKPSDYWDVYFDSMEMVKKAFDKAGIEIPYPLVDVHVKNK